MCPQAASQNCSVFCEHFNYRQVPILRAKPYKKEAILSLANEAEDACFIFYPDFLFVIRSTTSGKNAEIPSFHIFEMKNDGGEKCRDK